MYLSHVIAVLRRRQGVCVLSKYAESRVKKLFTSKVRQQSDLRLRLRLLSSRSTASCCSSLLAGLGMDHVGPWEPYSHNIWLCQRVRAVLPRQDCLIWFARCCRSLLLTQGSTSELVTTQSCKYLPMGKVSSLTVLTVSII